MASRRFAPACPCADQSTDTDPLVIDLNSHGEFTQHDRRDTARKRLENIYVRL
jgi:hypothetical protein